MKNKNENLKQADNSVLHKTGVTCSAFGYRFKIMSKQNNSILGTGRFTSSTAMTKEQQIDFFHKYTHGFYLHKGSFIDVDIFEADV